MPEDDVMPDSGRRQMARAVALGGMWMAMRHGMGATEAAADTVLNVRQFGA